MKAGRGPWMGVGAGLGLTFLLVLGLTESAGVFARTTTETTTLTATSTTQTTYTITSASTVLSTSNESAATTDCLVAIAPDAKVGGGSLANEYGTLVTYPSGAQVVFPQYGCPQPVSNKIYTGNVMETDNYELALAAVTNATVQAMENGTSYVYWQPWENGLSTGQYDSGDFNGNYGFIYQVVLYHYSPEFYYPCGFSEEGGSHYIVAGIEVDFFAPYSGTWELNDPSIHTVGQQFIDQMNSCPF